MPPRRCGCAEHAAALQPARLGLFRQGRVRHRDRRLQRRAADRPAERHALSQPRQRLSRQEATTPTRIADYDEAIKLEPNAYSYQNRGSAKQALGDLDGALADINEAIRLDPALPPPLINRAVLWRAKGDHDRAIADADRGDPAGQGRAAAVNIMTPPGSVLITAYTQRGLAYEAKGDIDKREGGFHRSARPSPPPTPAARPTRRPRRCGCRCCDETDALPARAGDRTRPAAAAASRW